MASRKLSISRRKSSAKLSSWRRLRKAGKTRYSELVSRLFAAVDAFAEEEEQADDITCVAIRRK